MDLKGGGGKVGISRGNETPSGIPWDRVPELKVSSLIVDNW